ncbi:FecCD family ABC transporter permease [Pseudokineococcus sp. 1T1Z-3]|uniref:FecCD family ABC transporter permease n=1 Tax=Pseudokineococcus sp. 1T1Z-3 TaxID=3132745 RepID=UPI0030B578DD
MRPQDVRGVPSSTVPPPLAPAADAQDRARARPRGTVLVAALVAVAVAGVASLMVGTRGLDPFTVLASLAGGGDAESRAIVLDQRLPRTVVGLLGGAALAVAGAVVQGHTRNPLADPGLLGITAGAAAAVVVGGSLLGLATAGAQLGAALLGAALGTAATVAVGLAAGRARDASPASLVLAGTAVSAALGAVTGLVLLLDASTLDSYRFWTVGSLAGGRDLGVVLDVLPVLALGLLLALAQAPALDALALGDDVARSLGRRLLPTRVVGLLAVTALAGGATALVGSLGFVGLVAPHLVRMSRPRGHASALPLCALVGAALVVAADVLGRLLVAPSELPVGVVLGVAGGPALLVVVLRLARARRGLVRTTR